MQSRGHEHRTRLGEALDPRCDIGRLADVQKQRQELEEGLREAQALEHNLKPLGSVQENLAKQRVFVGKVFDISLQGAREAAETSKQSATVQVKIVQGRIKASLEEIRASLESGRGEFHPVVVLVKRPGDASGPQQQAAPDRLRDRSA